MTEQITMEAAQAAMNAAIAKQSVALAAYREARDIASDKREAARDRADSDFDATIADAKAIRDAALEAARKDEVEANKLVRKASVAQAKAEAKKAAEGGA